MYINPSNVIAKATLNSISQKQCHYSEIPEPTRTRHSLPTLDNNPNESNVNETTLSQQAVVRDNVYTCLVSHDLVLMFGSDFYFL